MTEQRFIQKVTALITRPGPAGPDLLLFRHPNAGVQIPAGTVEAGEAPLAAVLREAWEETGLENLQVRAEIGLRDIPAPAGQLFTALTTKVYSRPDPGSFAWAELRRGLLVRDLARSQQNASGDWRQVAYEEWDAYPNPTYLTYQILGWVPADTLAQAQRRHFFHLEFTGHSPQTWELYTDNHIFQPFWAPLNALPEIVEPQAAWLKMVSELGYHL